MRRKPCLCWWISPPLQNLSDSLPHHPAVPQIDQPQHPHLRPCPPLTQWNMATGLQPVHGVIRSPACVVLRSCALFLCNQLEMISSAALVWAEDASLSILDVPRDLSFVLSCLLLIDINILLHFYVAKSWALTPERPSFQSGCKSVLLEKYSHTSEVKVKTGICGQSLSAEGICDWAPPEWVPFTFIHTVAPELILRCCFHPKVHHFVPFKMEKSSKRGC